MNIAESILCDAWAVHSKVVNGNRAIIKAILEGKEVVLPKSQTKGVQIISAKKDRSAFVADMWLDDNELDKIQTESFAVMPIQGTITKSGGLCSYGTAQMVEKMSMLGAHPKVKGVLLRIDSGGGMVAGTEAFAAAVRDFRATYNKPIAAVLEDMTASAAYWIASQADKVFVANKTTEVGSIGVLTTVVNDKKMWEDMGVDIVRVYATNSFNKNKEIEQALQGDTTALQARLDVIRDAFVGDVRRARRGAMDFEAMPKEKGVPIVFTGSTFMGEDVVKMGLADAMGGVEDALKYLEKEKRNIDKEKKIGSTVATSLQKKAGAIVELTNKPTVAAVKQPTEKVSNNQTTNTKMSVKKFFLATLAAMGITSAKTAENKELSLDQLAEGLSEDSTIDEAVVASIAEDAAKKAVEAQATENQKQFRELADKIEAAAKLIAGMGTKLGESEKKVGELTAEIAALKGAPTPNQKPIDKTTGDADNLEAHPAIQLMRRAGAPEDKIQQQKELMRKEQEKK